MMKKETINEKIDFKCGICGFAYEEKEWAEKCQEWCKKHHSCNMEITKHSVELNK